MCKCLEEMHRKIDSNIRERFSKKNDPVKSFSLSQTMSGKAIIGINIYLTKQMKPVESFFVAAYCPFCGEKYED